jgi:hypothetical protein
MGKMCMVLHVKNRQRMWAGMVFIMPKLLIIGLLTVYSTALSLTRQHRFPKHVIDIKSMSWISASGRWSMRSVSVLISTDKNNKY